jgi:plastocyanin
MKFIVALAMMISIGRGSAVAADLYFTATDPDGHTLANAVIALVPASGAASGGQFAGPSRQVIDQRHETFIPLVVIVPRGGQVVFRNSDTTHHHAYSFSPIKRFELMLDPGDESQPVQFDVAGVAAIGCNIHDQMVAYVYVTDSPWSAQTDADGRATIAGVPAGDYDATGWHPRLRPGAPDTHQHLVVGSEPQTVAVTLPVLPERPVHNRHEQAY